MDRAELLDRVSAVAHRELAIADDVPISDNTKLDQVARLSSVRLMAFIEGLENDLGIEFDIESLSGEVVTDVSQLLPLIESELAA